MLKNKIEKNMSLKIERKKNPGKISKPKLIFQTHNPWNSRPELNHKAKFQ
jgi:hypothetical protein